SEPDALVFGIADFHHAWRKACAAAGITGLHFHDLRHTAATRLDEAGFTVKQIATVLGNEDERITARVYINPTDATLAAAARALDKYQEQTSDDNELVTEAVN